MKALKAQIAAASAPQPVAEVPEAKIRKSYVTPARVGKKAVVGHFSPALSRQLGQIAWDNETTIQALLGEAIDLLLPKYGFPPAGER